MIKDRFGRVHNYLRISLTDRCNFHCVYCNPEGKEKDKLHLHNVLLSFEEIERLIKIFAEMGFDKIRFTGGEPLARKNISELFSRIKPLKEKFKLEYNITTNGTLINGKLHDYKNAGLDRINFSLDSLSSDTFAKITGKDSLLSVLDAIKQSRDAGFTEIKINTVIMNGINDSEIIDFCKFGIEYGINVRFIEYMPFSSNEWSQNLLFPSDKIIDTISTEFEIAELPDSSGSARNFKINNGQSSGKISIISSMTNHFCSKCNRLRITADGKMKLCLFSEKNSMVDLKELLREPEITDDAIKKVIAESLRYKDFEHPPAETLIKLQNNNMIKIGG